MASFTVLLLPYALLLLASTAWVSASIVEHTFEVENLVVTRLCQEQEIVAVNGQYPGPTIYAHEGDTVLVHVLNKSPYDITIHWHGVQMLFNGWADGASYVTQCPILPGNNYTYKFNVTNQEGTLWWHAHLSWLRATVHGALVIYPKVGRPYPFKEPDEEITIFLGDWFLNNTVKLEYLYLNEDEQVTRPNAFTINGQPGDLYKCSSNDTFKLNVKQGKTYLLRIICSGLNNERFFNIANHNMTVVSIDATYTIPYVTDVLCIAPGQTLDVLLEADQSPNSYFMTSYGYVSWNPELKTDDQTATGIVIYEGETTNSSSSSPVLPEGPDYRDTFTAHNFFASLKGLENGPFWVPVPQEVDENMFITVGMGVIPCGEHQGLCMGPLGGIIFGSMNNISFQLPTETSMLEAFYKNISGVYTDNFPNEPPTKFDYTNPENQENENLVWIGEKATKVKKLKYNATVQIVFQNTALVTGENHPVHLHGFNFHVLAQGFGNYDPVTAEKSFNLINPQMRNTIGVPALGWVVIRFQANNPGVWLMHCHLEYHQSVGVGTAFVVENGPSQATSLPTPPFDLPKCNGGLSNTASGHQEQVA